MNAESSDNVPYAEAASLAQAECLRSSHGGRFVHHSKIDQRMSALGHKRTFTLVLPMSALPLKADMVERDPDVRFVPTGDIAAH
jgi:hypothetical protein